MAVYEHVGKILFIFIQGAYAPNENEKKDVLKILNILQNYLKNFHCHIEL